MAVLTASTSNGGFYDLAGDPTPTPGQYVVVCIDAKDKFGVERKKYQSEETELADLTQFLFGGRMGDNTPFRFASRQMRISGNEKSALVAFLSSWLGQKPAMGWDYALKAEQGGMVGRKAIVSLGLEPSRDGSRQYLNILSISACPADLKVGPFGQSPAAKPQASAPARAAAPAAPAQELSADPIPF